MLNAEKFAGDRSSRPPPCRLLAKLLAVEGRPNDPDLAERLEKGADILGKSFLVFPIPIPK